MNVEALPNMIYTHGIDYDIYHEGENMEKAKVFTNGRSQAVRLPKEYRFDTDEVYINKIGDMVILMPLDSLEKAFDLGSSLLTDDFMTEPMPDEIVPERINL
jgi:antitoxin VapB